jgi:hypothetical protein
MYRITIAHPVAGQQPFRLTTQSRSLARSAALLGQENKLVVEVTAEAVVRVVKFKGVEPEKASLKK